MSDIVERLREHVNPRYIAELVSADLILASAERIESLEREIASLQYRLEEAEGHLARLSATQHHQGGEALLAQALRVLDKYADPTGYTDSNGDQMPADAVVHEGLLAKDTAAKIRAALAQQPLSVPTGWQLVPLEPTEAMKKAGMYADLTLSYGGDTNSFEYVSEETAAEVWENMIAAAPTVGGKE